jgi:hypothetical protein
MGPNLYQPATPPDVDTGDALLVKQIFASGRLEKTNDWYLLPCHPEWILPNICRPEHISAIQGEKQ